MSSIINKAVLVLNSSYEPVSITRAKNALKLLVKGTAVAEEDYGIEVYPGIMLPSVIRLRNYKRIPIRLGQTSTPGTIISANIAGQRKGPQE
jgi:hypothetical protein